MANPLLELKKLGQSVWLDFIRRDLISGGELQRLIDQDGLAGVTANPAIFEKAISHGSEYTVSLVATIISPLRVKQMPMTLLPATKCSAEMPSGDTLTMPCLP